MTFGQKVKKMKKMASAIALNVLKNAVGVLGETAILVNTGYS
jgi:hypothetical protein